MIDRFRAALGRDLVLLDAAMGTRLLALGLRLEDDDPCLWNLTHPETVVAIHGRDVAAGAGAVLTNTFGANRIWLARYGRNGAAEVAAINQAAVALARRAAGPGRFVVGDIGPAAAGGDGAVAEQAALLIDAGVEALLLETHRLDQAEAALRQIGRDPAANGRVPLLVSLVAWPDPLGEAVARLVDLGAVALGTNCQDGMAAALAVAVRLRQTTALPLIVKPAAGRPGGPLALPRRSRKPCRGCVRWRQSLSAAAAARPRRMWPPSVPHGMMQVTPKVKQQVEALSPEAPTLFQLEWRSVPLSPGVRVGRRLRPSEFWFHGESIMPPAGPVPDHDQRLKVLLKEFFEAFFLCFFPVWAARFEFLEIDWLDKELFLAPPQGEKRRVDLVARLRLRPGAPPPRTGETDLVALVHVEVESRASTPAFRPRMFEYYIQLRRDTGLPVLPIALFLRLGLDGIGWDAYEEHFWEQRILRFEYAYVGLPALDGEPYATGENLLGVALSTLMRLPADRRAELYAEGLKRIGGSGENDYRRFLLVECLEAYAELDEAQKERLQALLHTEAYQEVEPLMKTTYERGIEQGERRSALRLMEAKFGPLSSKVKQQVEALTPEALAQLQLDLLKAQALEELRLDD